MRPYITITRSQRATREEREERERDGEILHVFLSRSPPPPIITGIICLLARQTLKKTSNNTKNIAYFELCFLRLFLFETQRDITYAFQNKKGTAHGAETFCAVLSMVTYIFEKFVRECILSLLFYLSFFSCVVFVLPFCSIGRTLLGATGAHLTFEKFVSECISPPGFVSLMFYLVFQFLALCSNLPFLSIGRSLLGAMGAHLLLMSIGTARRNFIG